MADNGSRCGSRRFRRLRPRRPRARPRAPRASGKAGRLIQAAPREWACARSCGNSGLRAVCLPAWPRRRPVPPSRQPRLPCTYPIVAPEHEQRGGFTHLDVSGASVLAAIRSDGSSGSGAAHIHYRDGQDWVFDAFFKAPGRRGRPLRCSRRALRGPPRRRRRAERSGPRTPGRHARGRRARRRQLGERRFRAGRRGLPSRAGRQRFRLRRQRRAPPPPTAATPTASGPSRRSSRRHTALASATISPPPPRSPPKAAHWRRARPKRAAARRAAARPRGRPAADGAPRATTTLLRRPARPACADSPQGRPSGRAAPAPAGRDGSGRRRRRNALRAAPSAPP